MFHTHTLCPKPQGLVTFAALAVCVSPSFTASTSTNPLRYTICPFLPAGNASFAHFCRSCTYAKRFLFTHPACFASVPASAGLDYFGYFYINGRYFHASNLHNWAAVAKPVRGSTAKHKGKAQPIFVFTEGKCEVRADCRGGVFAVGADV